jgi:hypothetical protein
MYITLKNPKTGKLKSMKIGFSWTLLLFSLFFGIPLFLKRLYLLGVISLLIFLSSFIIPDFSISQSLFPIVNAWYEHKSVTVDGAHINYLLMTMFFAGVELTLSIIFGFIGNKLSAKKYIKDGWVFAQAEQSIIEKAKVLLGLD